ncbi:MULTISPECIES: TIGR02281 family clan AA aspartic protease [Marinimicrobium]|nr:MULTISPECIES: TIGR02281 family clan AA aspartic protease [Marinimicrobium]
MTQEQMPGQQAGRGMLVAAWIIGLALLTWAFGIWEDRKDNPNRSIQGQVVNGVQEVVLRRNRSGHYVVPGQINGEEATFLLDTGATDVVVSQDLAERAGLRAGARQWAMTANGRIEVRATRLERLELGTIQLRDVSASINPAMGGDQVLLGMSALGQVEFRQQGDRLTLRYQGD